MKSSDVLGALLEQASLALTGLPSLLNDGPINSFDDSFSVLLSLRSLASQLFGYRSPEYFLIQSYLDSLDNILFVGPLPLAVSR